MWTCLKTYFAIIMMIKAVNWDRQSNLTHTVLPPVFNRSTQALINKVKHMSKLRLRCFYYCPHPKDGEGNVFSLSTLLGYPPSWDGVPPGQIRTGVPKMAYPLPILVWGTPPRIGQQKEYFLRGGRYASSVQTEGLSCQYKYASILSCHECENLLR